MTDTESCSSEPADFEDDLELFRSQRWMHVAANWAQGDRFHGLLAKLLGRRTGVLGDREILRAIERRQIVIDPFDQDLLGSSSYDVRLGGTFYVADAGTRQPIFSPFDQESVTDYYRGPYKAQGAREYCEKHHLSDIPGIDPDELIIVLKPGECILAHTVEYIGAAYGATTMMKAKSSIGRINVSACDDAGWGDVGYINRWTFEIRNKNQTPVVLVVGMPIAQLVFLWVDGASINYATSGHYQAGVDLDVVKQTPIEDQMLPQLWTPRSKDKRQRLNPDQVF